MPRISEFYGVAIYMYYADHAPPHIHVMYGESEASFRIDTLHLLAGSLPARALRMALEWMFEHRMELEDNWLRASEHRPLLPIKPLE
ncbi:MAG: DUF4160 domain-containing protein [Chloroflexi bacterium]|nr:DUF4160 domain-containing protein [Chloroflexota bacterium]